MADFREEPHANLLLTCWEEEEEMSSSMRYRDRRQQKEDAPIQFERAVTGLWIILMFVVFPPSKA